jgi:hypothetical protein
MLCCEIYVFLAKSSKDNHAFSQGVIDFLGLFLVFRI